MHGNCIIEDEKKERKIKDNLIIILYYIYAHAGSGNK